MSYMLSKNYTIYEIFYTTNDKIYTTYGKMLDNIYEFRRQHMNYFTQHMKENYTSYENNLYNIWYNYTTYNQLLNNI